MQWHVLQEPSRGGATSVERPVRVNDEHLHAGSGANQGGQRRRLGTLPVRPEDFKKHSQANEAYSMASGEGRPYRRAMTRRGRAGLGPGEGVEGPNWELA